jgi:hypothetical protein
MAVSLEETADPNSLVPGVPVPLFQTRLAAGAFILRMGPAAKAQYAIADDGRILMNSSVDTEVSPITVMLNWTAALEQ